MGLFCVIYIWCYVFREHLLNTKDAFYNMVCGNEIVILLCRDSNDGGLWYLFLFQKLPYFGSYQSMREEKISELKKQMDLLAENLKPPLRSYSKPTKQVPAVKDVIGRALPKIGAYKRLDNKQQVVALIDDVSK